ncbi:MAG: methyltransferase domain-containing protein [Anaerolineae bacterium]|nr:methyltransferase domain-containing protein [Anaerolineae bacterium]
MTSTNPARPNLPPPEMARRQAEWLAPARRWLLEQAELNWRRSVLDLGCGFGSVTPELVAGSIGAVVALDRNWAALHHDPTPFTGAVTSCADARRLPFADASFDLVLCQLALLWMPLEATLAEVRRVLMPGGALVAIEPDYGGMIEYPPEIASQDLWMAGLRRAGADPTVGRKLPGLLAQHGFTVKVELLNRLSPPAPERLDLLAGLPLDTTSTLELNRIERAAAALTGAWEQVVHLPFMFITAFLPRNAP